MSKHKRGEDHYKFVNLEGFTNAFLSYVRDTGEKNNRNERLIVVTCACDRTVERIMTPGALVTRKSCGCLKAAISSERMKARHDNRHESGHRYCSSCDQHKLANEDNFYWSGSYWSMPCKQCKSEKYKKRRLDRKAVSTRQQSVEPSQPDSTAVATVPLAGFLSTTGEKK